ncbi:MAG: RNA polymerase sigma factor [Clostridia bacterium]|nr:RNA polymerase sigma factor [Clostridia bacterium]
MNKVSFEQLYMEQLPGLYRLAQGILRHTADAQDAVQQAVLQAWQHLDGIRPGSERAYLARIVINECRNIQRSRRRTVPVPDFPDRTAVPEAGLRELRDAVDRLPEKLRIPFLLIYVEGWSAKEAASILEISMFALKSRLKRAKKLLQSEFAEKEEAYGPLYTERSAENV